VSTKKNGNSPAVNRGITALCETVMRGLAVASEGGKLAEARETLGHEYYPIAVDAMRRHVKALFSAERRDDLLEELRVGGNFAERVIVGSIVADAAKDVVAAAAVRCPGCAS
jgi:hypothetical protein